MFHQSGGCCDGSSPMCFAKGDFIIGQSDVGFGHMLKDIEFWMSKDQFEYWQYIPSSLWTLWKDAVPAFPLKFHWENAL